MQINIIYKDKTYTLEYNRKVVAELETEGFKPVEFEQMPLTMSYKLFKGAFKKNHPKLSDTTIENIFDDIKNVGDLINTLGEMYAKTYEDFFEQGEAEWKVIK